MSEQINEHSKENTVNFIDLERHISVNNNFIKRLLKSGKHRISIELLPKSFDDDLLSGLSPQFVSVTWFGITYSEFSLTVTFSKELGSQGYPVLQHLAGRNLNKSQVIDILNQLKDGGINNILALQGDWEYALEKNDGKCDFPYATNLVSFIKENFDDQFCVGVAGYPETHPHSKSVDEDFKFLAQKVSAGADFIITQASFDYEVLEKFAKACRERKINLPILPGIFIIKSYKSLVNVSKRCKLQIPRSILDFIEQNKDREDIIQNYGLDLATELVTKILANGELFAGVHIFSLNDLDLVNKLVNKLKIEK